MANIADRDKINDPRRNMGRPPPAQQQQQQQQPVVAETQDQEKVCIVYY